MSLRAKLDEAIPKEAIIEREAWRGGPRLSYLSGAYVKNRLNQVVGQGNWSYDIADLTKVFEGVIEQREGEAFTTSYIARITLRVDFGDDNKVYFEEVGYGDGTDKKSQGKAHELATKEAVTDALKRAAVNLGLSMGLELYFKEGQYVGETSTMAKEENTVVNKPAATGNETQVPAKAAQSTSTMRKQIKAVFRVLKEQEKTTAETFAKEFLNGTKVDDLTEDMLPATIEKIKTAFPNYL